MVDRMTSVRLRSPEWNNGWAEWGRKTRQEMIAIYRKRAERDLANAQAILDADDADFLVQTYLGHNVQHKLEEVHD